MIEAAVSVGEGGAEVGVFVGAYGEVEVGFAVFVEVGLVVSISVVEFIDVEFGWGGDGVEVDVIEGFQAIGFCLIAFADV